MSGSKMLILVIGIGRLKLADAIEVLDSMAKEGSIEWDKSDGGGGGGGIGGGGGSVGVGKTAAVVWWRKPEEWASVIYDWVSKSLGRSCE